MSRRGKAGAFLACGVAVMAASLVGCPIPAPETREKVWSIGIYEGPSPLELSPAAGIANPVLRAEDVTDVPADFVADPFLLRHDGQWLMFFEVFHARDRQGDIGLATSVDGRRWSYSGVVLDEPFSVSYPQVFRRGDAFYMLPETHEAGVARLYRAVEFPTRWAPDTVLLQGDLVDPTLAFERGRVWLFAETNPRGNDELRLFSAPALEGPWSEHPRSPLVRGDSTRARPAGPVIRDGGRLLRLAQVDSPDYGVGVRAFEILALDASTYEERERAMIPPLEAHGEGWAAAGMHHVCAVELGGGLWRAAVDGYRYAREDAP